MFQPTRDESRLFLFDLWDKYRAGQPLAGVETLAIEIVLEHTEYHALLDNRERYLHRDYLPENGESNPFLHLMLHLTVVEQVSIDQPPGVRARYEKLLKKHGDKMTAQHDVMVCLAEEIWRIQSEQTPFDAAIYLQCLDAQCARRR